MKITNSLKIGVLSLLLFSYSCDQKAKEKNESETSAIEETEAPETPIEEVVEKEITYNVDQPASIIKAVADASGGWNAVWDLNDVEYTYVYEQADGKKDISKERYIFKGEHSWASYNTHEVNVLPVGNQNIIQNFSAGKATCSMDGKEMSDEKTIGTTAFLRQVNYYWFLMNFKIGDPGTIHKYLGQEEVAGTAYDKVSVAYTAEQTGKEANDAYILYVNPETKLVDQFYFSLPAWGINDTVLLMKVKYSEVDGIQIPAVRYVYIPDDKGQYPETPSITETTSDVKFNNGFKTTDLTI